MLQFISSVSKISNMFGAPTRLQRQKSRTAPFLLLEFSGLVFILIGLVFIFNRTKFFPPLIRIEDLSFLFLFPIIGIVIVVIARILSSRSSKRFNEIINDLMQTSETLTGVVARVKSVGGPSRNNNYIIIVSVTDKRGVVQEFMSDRVSSYADLEVIDFSKNPISVNVYVSLTDPSRYYVDILSMPDLTSLSRQAFMELAKK